MRPPSYSTVTATPVANCWFEGDLLCIDNLNCRRTPDGTQQHYRILRALAGDQKLAILKEFPSCEMFSPFVRKVTAENLLRVGKAVAIIAPEDSWDALAASFRGAQRAGVPVKLFAEEEEARRWLFVNHSGG